MSHFWRSLLVAAVILASARPARSDDIRVGFINPNQPAAFWSLISATMQAAAGELGIDVDIRLADGSHDKAFALAREFLARQPRLDYLVGTNDFNFGADLVKLADAAGVPLLLLSNDLDKKDWAEYGEPRTKYRHWLGSIVPDHESGGYGIAEGILTEAARIKTARPLKLLAISGDPVTPASLDRVQGLKRSIAVMTKLLGPNSVELVDLRYLDWTEKTAEASVREFVQKGPRIDALWAANDPMALGALTALGEAGYKPGVDVVVGGLNWNQPAIERVLKGEMLLSHGGHFLGGAWAMVLLRDHHDGRDFAEEDVRLQFPMGAFDAPVARRFPNIGSLDWKKVDFTKFAKSRNPTLTRYDFTPDAVLRQLSSLK
ncbi:MAG: ABC transporter substrate-binding protein [Proteobacteria bacterium]|nr:ABC transporter substrate-binding protein [Pseudomonadota bacterium]MBI3498409.1 ABC transporter substrate-binding protein [Pseudomonadota bacterium]